MKIQESLDLDAISKDLKERYNAKTSGVIESAESESAPAADATVTEGAVTEGADSSSAPAADDKTAVVEGEADLAPENTADPEAGGADDVSESAVDADVMTQAAAELVRDAQAKADAKVTEAQAEIDKLKAELAKSTSKTGVLQEMIGTEPQGVTDPAEVQERMAEAGNPDNGKTLEVMGQGNKEFREFERLVEGSPAAWVNSDSGRCLAKDTRRAEEYLRNNRKAVREGLEAVLKENMGWFNGGATRGMTVKEAITLGADVPSIFFDYLNNFVRESHYEDLILSQFFNRSVSIGVQPGLTTQVPRYPYEVRPTTIADRQLTPGTDISAASTAIVETYTPVTIEELGLTTPIGMSNFIEAYSMIEIESIVGRNLARDYAYYKDLRARALLFTANTNAYNDNGVVVAAPTGLNAGSGGKLTQEFLIRLYAQMKSQLIPVFPNGLYALVVTPNQLADLQADLNAQGRDILQMTGQDIVLDMIRRDPDRANGFGGEASGFKGEVDGFMVFCQNAFGVGTNTTDPLSGVTDEVTAAGNVIFESGFAFGRDAMAWSTALPVEIRFDEVTDFNRRTRAIWYAHEAFAPLDINEVLPASAGTTGQQRRVLRVRTARGQELV